MPVANPTSRFDKTHVRSRLHPVSVFTADDLTPGRGVAKSGKKNEIRKIRASHVVIE
jgi:hypothetical protein